MEMSGTDRKRTRAGRRLAPVLVLCCFMLALAAGCADEPDLESGDNPYTASVGEARLRIMAVDDALSRDVQSGALEAAALPPGKMLFREPAGADGAAGTPWVVDSDFFFTQMDVYFAQVEAAGGSYTVIYQLNDEEFRKNSGKLQQMTAELAAAAGGPGSLAIIFNGEVRAVVPVTSPITNGEIRVTGLSESVATEIIDDYPDRAARFPDGSGQASIGL